MVMIDYPELDDSVISEARKLIGVPLRRYLNNTEVTMQSLITWSRSIGDRNPLYLNDNHARLSRYGTFIAPPFWLYSVDDTVVAPKLPGIHSIYAAVDWEFFKVIRRGDCITTDARLTDVIEKNGQFCGKMVMQTGEVNYYNQKGEKVATAKPMVMRTPRKAAQERGKYTSWQSHQYTRKELTTIENAYDSETWRGSTIRYWDDTEVGEILIPIARGPLNSEDVHLFVLATNPVRSYRRFLAYLDRHPLYAFRDPASNSWEGWENQLIDDKVARKMGFPFAHASGIQRVSIMGNLVTNWMGDDAFLVKIGVELRLPWIYGDTLYCK